MSPIPAEARTPTDRDWHTDELPPLPQRDFLIPAERWVDAPAALRTLGGDLGIVLVAYPRGIGGYLLWRAGPAGLTPRETEVLILIARGASTRQAASTLGITAKTAETHIERIYAKTGASTRSTATLFAMQHGLLDSLGPAGL